MKTTKISRFFGDNMSGWPKNDANYILYFEVILMTLFLVMNATDVYFQKTNNGNIISGYIFNYFSDLPLSTLHIIERFCWWSHIIGIFMFMNYLYYSKRQQV